MAPPPSTSSHLDTVKSSLASSATCSQSTVTAVQQILGSSAGAPSATAASAQGKGNKRGTAAAAASTSRGRQPAAKKSEQLSKSCLIAPKDKYLFATEVVNISLKTLTAELKQLSSKTAPPKPIRSADAANEKSQLGSELASDKAAQPLKELGGKQVSKNKGKAELKTAHAEKHLSAQRAASSSGTSNGRNEVSPGTVAVAECSRLGFAYLRSSEAERVAGKDGRGLQLENGMLALVGKLIGHGLENLAARELRLLKSRLDARSRKSVTSDEKPNVSRGKAQASTADNETLASLLHLQTVDPDDDALPIAISHQLYVLRIIAIGSRASTIQLLLPFVEMSADSSPINNILHFSRRTDCKEKAARHLESLAHWLLTLCPSISSAADETASAKTAPSSRVILRLQHLAFVARWRWWGLSKHQGNAKSDLLEPFERCLAAFARRSTMPAAEKFEFCKTNLFAFCKEIGLEVSSSSSNLTIRTMSGLAQASGRIDEALEWTKKGSPTAKPDQKPSEAARAAAAVRVAALTLEKDALSSMQLPAVKLTVLERQVDEALANLKGGLKGDAAETDFLLGEVVSLRRVAAKILIKEDCKADASGDVDGEDTLKSVAPVKRSEDTLSKLCFRAVSGCVKFFVRFTGRTPEGSDSKGIVRRQERLNLAVKVGKGFLDTTTAACRIATTKGLGLWETFDAALQDCYVVRLELQRATGVEILGDLEAFLLKLSNLYWARYLECRKSASSSSATVTGNAFEKIRTLRRSVDMLRDTTSETKRAGMLAAKQEKLGNAYESEGQWASAQKALHDAVNTYRETGLLADIDEAARSSSLSQVWGQPGPVASLKRTLKSLNSAALQKTEPSSSGWLIVNNDREGDETASLWEWQFHILCASINRKNWASDAVRGAVSELINRLLAFYDSASYPIRRLRTAIIALRLNADYPGILQSNCVDDLRDCGLEEGADLKKDVGLRNYACTLRATFDTLLTFTGDSTPDLETIKSILDRWRELVSATDSGSAKLSTCFDDTDDWVELVDMIARYLDMKGLGLLRVQALETVVGILRRSTPPTPNDVVSAVAELGTELSRIGYSSRAGEVLEMVATAELEEARPDRRTHYHLAAAEHALSVGLVEKSRENLLIARSLATTAGVTGEPAPASYTDRLKGLRLRSHAFYVASLYAKATGNGIEALASATRCVRLNDKIWATIENMPNPKQVPASRNPASDDSASADQAPLVQSITHQSLKGSAFWSTVQPMVRGLCQLSSVLAHHGGYREATYFAEKAQKIVEATNSQPLIIEVTTMLADYTMRGGSLRDGERHLHAVRESAVDSLPDLALVKYRCAQAHHQAMRGDAKEALTSFEVAERTLKRFHDLQASSGRIARDTADLTERVAKLTLSNDAAVKPAAKPKRQQRAHTATAVKTPNPAAKTVKKPNSARLTADSSPLDESPLANLQAEILCKKATVYLLQDEIQAAFGLLDEVESLKPSGECLVRQHLTRFNALFMEGMKELATDFTFNGLPESTISFPSTAQNEHQLSEAGQMKAIYLSPTQSSSTRTMSPRKGAKSDRQVMGQFLTLLQAARDCILSIQPTALAIGSSSMMQSICGIASHITILLSATCASPSRPVPASLSTARLLDLAAIRIHDHEQRAIVVDKHVRNTGTISAEWPAFATSKEKAVRAISDTALSAQFQKDFIDIIPASWTAVSLSLNDARDELYAIRYDAGQSPFILRLPMARHNSRDADEDIFGFDEGKTELLDIIDLSDDTTKRREVKGRKAKLDWWAERETLNTRLKDLLENVENIWLGGFRGVFSPRQKHLSHLMERFEKGFLNLLQRHLPSRRNKATKARGRSKAAVAAGGGPNVNLDPRILSLFVGLGNAANRELDLDEQLVDLLYFVVDVLQFNGEQNAYDEIDFDALVVETYDILRSYHSAAAETPAPADTPIPHTILILDKRLHAFPWESIPSLQNQSVSRLPSLGALRQRILAARSPPRGKSEAPPGHYIAREEGGTTILNPGGDLSKTQQSLEPILSSLDTNYAPEASQVQPAGLWRHHTGAAHSPDETGFIDALASRPLLLYFGHGSGAQYVRGHSIRRLAASSLTQPSHDAEVPFSPSNRPTTPTEDHTPQSHDGPLQPTCATALLLGCSSAALTEHGDFEPSGTLSHYLAASSPAVLGMLWDVTDRDCDRFAVGVGQAWGLWPGVSAEMAFGPKGGKGGKGKAVAAAAAAAAGSSPVKKGKRAKALDDVAEVVEEEEKGGKGGKRVSLVEATARSRGECYLRYLNGAAAVVYGIPVYLD